MNLANCNQVESLSRRGILALQAPAGTRIRSQAGSVWITQDGDPNDWVLKPGESAAFEQSGALMVSAFDPALICIEAPSNGGPLKPAVLKRVDPAAIDARRARRPGEHPVRARFARWLNTLVGA